MDPRRWAIAFALAAAGCSNGGADAAVKPSSGEVGATCAKVRFDTGKDRLYDGYAACSDARYPDFASRTGRWTGDYPAHCAGQRGEHAYACAEQLFWHTFQFDAAGRRAAYDDIAAMAAAGDGDDGLTATQRTRLHWRAGQLAVALLAEQSDVSVLGKVKEHLYRAHALEPDHVIIEAWLRAFEINTAAVLGGDVRAEMDKLWGTYEKDRPAVVGTVIGTTSSMPMSSGWPKVGAELLDKIDPMDCTHWCGWEFRRAPHVFPGQTFSYAEVYARVGNAEKARYWLEETRKQKSYDTWPFRDANERALADVPGFVGKFAARGPDARVADLLVSASSGTCMVCHAPLR